MVMYMGKRCKNRISQESNLDGRGIVSKKGSTENCSQALNYRRKSLTITLGEDVRGGERGRSCRRGMSKRRKETTRT